MWTASVDTSGTPAPHNTTQHSTSPHTTSHHSTAQHITSYHRTLIVVTYAVHTACIHTYILHAMCTCTQTHTHTHNTYTHTHTHTDTHTHTTYTDTQIHTHTPHTQTHRHTTHMLLSPCRGVWCAIDWKTSRRPRPKLRDMYDGPLQVCAYIGAVNQDQRYPVKVSGYTTHMHTECFMCHLVPVVHTCIQYISVLCRCSAAVVSTSCHLHTTHCINWLLPMYTSLHTQLVKYNTFITCKQ